MVLRSKLNSFEVEEWVLTLTKLIGIDPRGRIITTPSSKRIALMPPQPPQ
jgi:hypothetical protein